MKSKTKKSTAIRAALAAGDTDIKKLSKKYDVSSQYIYNLRSAMNKKKKFILVKLPKASSMTPEINDEDEGISDAELEYRLNKNPGELLEKTIARLNSDPVNHPPHYTAGKIEVIDFIEDQQLGYHLGNVVKYVCRADHKGSRLEDLKKAAWYLDREIEKSSKI